MKVFWGLKLIQLWGGEKEACYESPTGSRLVNENLFRMRKAMQQNAGALEIQIRIL